MRLGTEPRKPRKPRPDMYRLEILNALRRMGTKVKVEMRKTIATWAGEKPTFEDTVSLKGGDAVVEVQPEGSEIAVWKWIWLDKGTKIRWALMSGGWASKTTPGVRNSGVGAGHVIIVGKRAMTKRGIAARPGIEARNWSDDIETELFPVFIEELAEALRRATEKGWL